MNDEELVAVWFETVKIIQNESVIAAEINDRKFFERLGICEQFAVEGLITQLYKERKLIGAFNHKKYDVNTQNYVKFVVDTIDEKVFKPTERMESFNEIEEC